MKVSGVLWCPVAYEQIESLKEKQRDTKQFEKYQNACRQALKRGEKDIPRMEVLTGNDDIIYRAS